MSAPAGDKVTFIGIGGGRGAGKAYTCRNVIDKVRERGYSALADSIIHLNLDDFHCELPHADRVQMADGKARINFDHPESFDFELLAQVLDKLRQGLAVDVPVWDCAAKKRMGVRHIATKPKVVLVEGILVLYTRAVRQFLDMQVFVDVDSDTRLGRQVRQVLEGTGEEEAKNHTILRQFLDGYLYLAKPSFEEFILPTKRWADVIVPRGDINHVAIELIAQRLIELGHEAAAN
ncbi:P-loop containing nucleoside triphosphate hydrolase protein [Linderina pennispora]|uniref:p-loop containing nucleoside triphosphate hydrolase protein n=1 Tax=Linderina pennispora TaxID=61395 RepID=A0A1Y1WIA4_9FUNG|nr:P-loop containing nucleoside triphosphate hydrolase protein [Linderina pennispora]ORX73257.1 P-loop containing nucleoside triphosphate hydrolase protein [Linderina pennispora]